MKNPDSGKDAATTPTRSVPFFLGGQKTTHALGSVGWLSQIDEVVQSFQLGDYGRIGC